MELYVSSEINRLNSVIVHTPGHEVSIVNPEFKDELLFDDIIFEEDARREHRDMLKIFEIAMPRDSRIFQISQLLRTVFAKEEVRHYFVELLIKAFPEDNFQIVERELCRLSADSLLQLALNGTTPDITHFNIRPAPNLLFTRDLAVVINDSVLLSHAAKKARIRESLLMQTLIKHHPLFSDIQANIIYSNTGGSIEGGDILVYSDKIVLIGMSERTSFSSLMETADILLSGKTEYILAVDIPKQRASMHLDTIFTFCDIDECLVFPPAVIEKQNNVVLLSKKDEKIVMDLMPSLKKGLEAVTGIDFKFIKCGGDDRTNQFREQWTDGANMLALAPGVIVGYDRNTYTFEALKNYGYSVVNQDEFIEQGADGSFEPSKAGKLAITFKGHELCRGRGGARCMTLPLSRLP